MLKETDPETFWQTPLYEGWPAVLIRYSSADPERVRAMIERSRDDPRRDDDEQGNEDLRPPEHQLGLPICAPIDLIHFPCSLLFAA
jgi:hypothetical protein